MHFDGTLILLYFIEMLPRTVSVVIILMCLEWLYWQQQLAYQ